jgi:hypothetical protein
VIFAKPLPDLQAQLLSFPTGEIDAPNALAYALRMKPGAPMYDDFAAATSSRTCGRSPGDRCGCALNATRNMTTGRARPDHRRHGAGDRRLRARGSAGSGRRRHHRGRPDRSRRQGKADRRPLHFDQHNNVGLAQAIGRSRWSCGRASTRNGRETTSADFSSASAAGCHASWCRATPWTLNALAGGLFAGPAEGRRPGRLRRRRRSIAS